MFDIPSDELDEISLGSASSRQRLAVQDWEIPRRSSLALSVKSGRHGGRGYILRALYRLLTACMPRTATSRPIEDAYERNAVADRP